MVKQTLYYMCGMITINFHSKVYLRTDTAATQRDTSAFYAVITLIQNKGKAEPPTFNTLFKLACLLIYCTRYYVKTVFHSVTTQIHLCSGCLSSSLYFELLN